MDSTLGRETEGKVRTLTLRRPAQGNGLTNELTERLAEELRLADADPNVAVVVLTGAGDIFCNGLDRDQVTSETYRYGLVIDERRSPWKVLFAMDTPVIAAVNGPALNSGFGLALMASFIVAADTATFGENYATIQHTHPMGGLIPLMGLTLGVRRARELSFFGEELSAIEAYERGLVNHVLPADQVMPYVRQRAKQLARGSDQRTVALMNGLYRQSQLNDLKSSWANEEHGFKARELDTANVLRRYRERIWVRSDPVQPFDSST